jgi:CheY-like chemotaxis protein
VPRILVADDNSNIHRTVALALKEAGVDVVAVGNGEAAVRKIAEIKPDLVLADIFMPVRNGYEVCEFVKKDPRFAQIPVVLLIGAFDPFDEREAQRVQADAILKKPFVPPDSLLRTVSDLLAQSATRSAPAAAAPAQDARPPAPSPASQAPTVEYMDQAPEEMAPAKARLEWNSDEQPLAFGTLLETPSTGDETDETVMTSRRDPTLGEPAFWAPKAAQEGEDGESEPDGPEAQSSTGLVDEEQWDSGTGLDEVPAQTEPVSEATQPEPLLDLEEIAPELPEFVAPVSQFAQASTDNLPDQTIQLPELPTLELASPQDLETLPTIDSLAATPSFELDATKQISSAAQESISGANDLSWATPTYPGEQAVAQLESAATTESKTKNEKEPIEAATPSLATLAPFLAKLTSAASSRSAGEKDPFDFGPIPELSGEIESHSIESKSKEAADPPSVLQLDRADIEAIAQRIIERMQPQLVDLLTRELLQPAVEAMVQRELEKK